MSYIDVDDIKEVKFMGSRKEFSFLLFVLLLFFGIVPALIYIVYYSAKSNDIFMYAVKFNNGTIKYEEFSKKSKDLEKIKGIEAKQLFNENN